MRLQQRSRDLAVVAVTTFALTCVCPTVSAQTQPTRTVLTIYWGAENFPGTERIDAAIQEVLRNTDVPVNYFAEYLETEEFQAEIASTSLRDYIRRKYERRHIDVVVAVAGVALQFALRYREELFPAAPIVFQAVAIPPAVVARTTPDVTGVLNDTPFTETLELALHLHSSTKRVFVIARAPSVEGYEERIRSALSRFSNRVELTFLTEKRTIPALLAAVKAMPPQSLILYMRYVPDEPALNVYPDEIARLIAQASPVPIYTNDDTYLGTGVVGGMMRTAETSGTNIGNIVRRILNGTPPQGIPITAVPTTPMFDWRQVKRFGIDRSRLPPEARVLFQTPTAWEAYRGYVVGTIAVVSLQLALIAGLLTQRARRRRAEQTIRTREASLRKSYDRIRQLAGRLINAQETARASIAQDLHDDICQRLAMVSTAVDHLKSSSGDIQSRDTQRYFAALARDTRGTFEAVRRLSHELHPATLRVLGLAPTLKSHCAEIAQRHDVQVTFTAEGDLRDVPPDVAVCFFRIAQESLRNGVVHGASHRFTVSLSASETQIEMTVTDDGRGFNLDEAHRRGNGFGVVSMEERAHAVGASLLIVTGAERGTTIRIKVPLTSESPLDARDASERVDTISAKPIPAH